MLIGYADFRRVLENTLTQQKMVPPFELASRIQVKDKITTAQIVSEFNKNVTTLFENFKDNINIDSLDKFIDIILNTDRYICYRPRLFPCDGKTLYDPG